MVSRKKQRIVFVCSTELRKAIDDERRSRKWLPTRGSVIREILWKGLDDAQRKK